MFMRRSVSGEIERTHIQASTAHDYRGARSTSLEGTRCGGTIRNSSGPVDEG